MGLGDRNSFAGPDGMIASAGEPLCRLPSRTAHDGVDRVLPVVVTNLRPGLARRAILDGALGQACVDDLRRTNGVMGDEYLTVGATAAAAIIDGYKAGKLPLKEGTKPGKTTRAEVYARSPLRPSQFQVGVA